MAILEIWHFSFTVSDLDAAVSFYVDLLDCKLVGQQEQNNACTRSLVGYPDAHLRTAQIEIGGTSVRSGHQLELVEYLVPLGRRGDTNISNPGAAHLAFRVSDLQAEYARLMAQDVRFFSTPIDITAGRNKGGRAVYFHGPDDIVHELVQPPPLFPPDTRSPNLA
jgi:catechol 2,3-dioxygenase-like lactoylglutathione lyase family enzyme